MSLGGLGYPGMWGSGCFGGAADFSAGRGDCLLSQGGCAGGQ